MRKAQHDFISARFRVWDIRRNVMVEDALVLTETKRLVTVNNDFNNAFAFFDGVIWMQSLQIPDCTGKEVFEGDILTDEPALTNLRPTNFVVVKLGCNFRLATEGFLDIDVDEQDVAKMKMIGNIYQNPELK